MSDRDRFDEVYDRHYRDVLAYCQRRVGPLDAQAAANEVMAVAWRRLDDLPSGDRALPWLYGVARNVLSHHWRATRRRRRLEAELRGQAMDRPLNPEHVVVMRDELDRVLEAASRLSNRDQEILRLAGWEGLSHGQIAEMFGCSVAAVDQRLHRAKRRLADKYIAATEPRTLGRVVERNAGGGQA